MRGEAPVTGPLTSLAELEEIPAGREWRRYLGSLRSHPSFRRDSYDLAARRIRYLLRGGDTWRAGVGHDADTRAVLAYAEQFTIDANGIDERLGRAMKRILGADGLVVLTLWLGVVEAEERLRGLCGIGVEPAGDAAEVPLVRSASPVTAAGHPWPDDPSLPRPSVQELVQLVAPRIAIQRARVAAAMTGALSSRLQELLRLISANAVDCRYCRNVRYRDASDVQLVTEDEVADLVLGDGTGASSLDDLALRIGRAHFAGIAMPDDLVARFVEELDRTAQLELLVTLARYPSGSKAMIALGLVPERVPVTVL